MATSPPALTALDTSAFDVAARPTQSADTDAEVQSPSLSTPSARARFEFEHGRGNEGTKVLMVEWEDDAVTRGMNGVWNVTWEGKPAEVMAVSETAEERITVDDDSAPSTAHSDVSVRQNSHRLYFLLGPKKSIPATITLTKIPTGKEAPVLWKTNPLPAIFPKSLADPKSQGTKGVLHGIWAEKRLAKLRKEIEEEAKANSEGIALHMAVTERDWIESTYGLAPKPQRLALNTATSSLASNSPRSPLSPVSPGGTRLSEKLKGLRLQTNEQKPLPVAPQPKAVSIMPEQAGELSRTTSEVQSIGAVLSGQQSSSAPVRQEQEEEELFALPLSPRSPEMTKSPFSFTAEDTRGYLSKRTVGT
jgi:hypothetical protein